MGPPSSSSEGLLAALPDIDNDNRRVHVRDECPVRDRARAPSPAARREADLTVSAETHKSIQAKMNAAIQSLALPGVSFQMRLPFHAKIPWTMYAKLPSRHIPACATPQGAMPGHSPFQEGVHGVRCGASSSKRCPHP